MEPPPAKRRLELVRPRALLDQTPGPDGWLPWEVIRSCSTVGLCGDGEQVSERYCSLIAGCPDDDGKVLDVEQTYRPCKLIQDCDGNSGATSPGGSTTSIPTATSSPTTCALPTSGLEGLDLHGQQLGLPLPAGTVQLSCAVGYQESNTPPSAHRRKTDDGDGCVWHITNTCSKQDCPYGGTFPHCLCREGFTGNLTWSSSNAYEEPWRSTSCSANSAEAGQSGWGNWTIGKCSKPCGGGTQEKERFCELDPCIRIDNNGTTSFQRQIDPCNMHPCETTSLPLPKADGHGAQLHEELVMPAKDSFLGGADILAIACGSLAFLLLLATSLLFWCYRRQKHVKSTSLLSPLLQHDNHDPFSPKKSSSGGKAKKMRANSEVFAGGSAPYTGVAIAAIAAASHGHGQPNFRCHVCGRVLTTQSRLEHHLRTHQRLSCPECGKMFWRKSLLRDHRKRRHSTGSVARRHACRICAAKFCRLSGLETHMRSHTGVKPFKCERCGRRFSSKSNCRRHLLTHPESRQAHPCVVCGSTFALKSYLVRHLQTNLHKTNAKAMAQTPSKLDIFDDRFLGKLEIPASCMDNETVFDLGLALADSVRPSAIVSFPPATIFPEIKLEPGTVPMKQEPPFGPVSQADPASLNQLFAGEMSGAADQGLVGAPRPGPFQLQSGGYPGMSVDSDSDSEGNDTDFMLSTDESDLDSDGLFLSDSSSDAEDSGSSPSSPIFKSEFSVRAILAEF